MHIFEYFWTIATILVIFYFEVKMFLSFIISISFKSHFRYTSQNIFGKGILIASRTFSDFLLTDKLDRILHIIRIEAIGYSNNLDLIILET